MHGQSIGLDSVIVSRFSQALVSVLIYLLVQATIDSCMWVAGATFAASLTGLDGASVCVWEVEISSLSLLLFVGSGPRSG